jgi:GPH family glycoside/pentoside/hexuronide:cation symporter
MGRASRGSDVSGVASHAAPARTSAELRVPIGTILSWSAPALGVGAMFFLVNLYLMKFSTDVLLIAPGAMGIIFGLSRIWDAISDPLAGYFSDRTRSRLGRRRPWLLAAIVPSVVGFLMVWSPPAVLSGPALLVWMAAGIFGFYTAMTIFSVPHASLGAELSTSYDDRNRVFGWRQLAFNGGAFAALAGMSVLIGSPEPRVAAFRLALVASIATAGMILWAVVRVRERPEYQGRGATRPLSAYADVWRNPHARLLLAVLLIENLGAAQITILTPYVSQYIIGTPEKTPLFIFCYMSASAATVLLWVRVAARVGKKHLWIFSMTLTALAFGGMFFGGKGDVLLIASLATLGGAAAGCGAVVGPSMQADAIDYDEYRTGQRKEGAYFAAWSFVFKGASGLTFMLVGIVLQLSGFEPNVEQSEQVKLAMRSLFALFPLGCYLIGALLLTRFGLNRREHAEIRAALDARQREGRGGAGSV